MHISLILLIGVFKFKGSTTFKYKYKYKYIYIYIYINSLILSMNALFNEKDLELYRRRRKKNQCFVEM